MLLKPLALVAAAAAFVIVPEISEQDERIVEALPIQPDTFQLPPEVLGQSLEVPCRQCKGENTRLKLDFAVEDGSKLVLNGFELYPNADPWNGNLAASLLSGEGEAKEQRLGFSLSVLPRAMDEDQQMELVDIVLRIIEVSDIFIDGIPSIRVGLVKAPAGEIIIANMDVREPREPECNTLWCRAKSMFGGGFKGLTGCRRHGRKGYHGKHRGPGSKHHGDGERHGDGDHRGPGAMHHGDGEHRGPGSKHHGDGERHGDGEHHGPGGFRHHGHGEHRGHGEHHNHSWKSHYTWGHLLSKIASHIVLPVLMGIAAGVGVAFLAMFLCSVAYACRFSRFIRRQPESPRSVGENSNEYATAEDEKRGLMEAEEAQDSHPAPYKDDVAHN